MNNFVLRNGYKIPSIGFGTWKIEDGKSSVDSVKAAINCGYRHIDGAAFYGNEKSVGDGILQSGIKREELFITSKVWNSDRGYHKTLAAFDKTLSDLKLKYLDLYLIHWPANAKQFENFDEINLDTWRAMTQLYNEGKVKSIGVSNFMPHHLKALLQTNVPPMVNQIEYHPGHMQQEAVAYCKDNGIVVEAWSPLGRGKVLTNPQLAGIAKKYGKSVAQLCIRWVLQNGILPLPKSVTPDRIAQNLNIFDFKISDEDMAFINSMPPFGHSGLNPDEIEF